MHLGGSQLRLQISFWGGGFPSTSASFRKARIAIVRYDSLYCVQPCLQQLSNTTKASILPLPPVI